MNLENAVRKYVGDGYELDDAISKVAQDIILLKISKSKFKNHITIKGGVVMHSISNSIRRATRDLDLDFIKYSLEDNSIKEFIKILDSVKDNIKIKITEEIEELHHQDYNGKRVFIKITDIYDYSIKTKLDIGVQKLLDLEQDNYYFNLDGIDTGVSLLINFPGYKDLFDFYYLISNKKLNTAKLITSFKILIFDDKTMRENTVNDVLIRLNKTFSSNIFKSNLSNPKINWLDISIDDAIISVLKFIEELESITVHS